MRFAEIDYLRVGRKGGEHEEHSVVFLVDASTAAAPDSAAAAALAGARGAAAAETAAKAEQATAEAEVRPWPKLRAFFGVQAGRHAQRGRRRDGR